MTDNFEKDINIPSKEIIMEFSDGYCIVLENNEISMRDNVFTKLQIVFGKRTNELLEFVKELYLNKKAKEQECKELKQTNLKLGAELCGKLQNYMRAIDEIERYCKEQNLKYDTTACDILDIINKTKDN